MDLSELIDEIREIEIYETNPEDWMGYIEYDYDDASVSNLELAQHPSNPLLDAL